MIGLLSMTISDVRLSLCNLPVQLYESVGSDCDPFSLILQDLLSSCTGILVLQYASREAAFLFFNFEEYRPASMILHDVVLTRSKT